MKTRPASRSGPQVISKVAGLTLIELMFALGIVALTLSLVFGALVHLSNLSQMAERRAIAATHLGTIVETLQTLPYEDLLHYDPSSFEGLARGETAIENCRGKNPSNIG